MICIAKVGAVWNKDRKVLDIYQKMRDVLQKPIILLGMMGSGKSCIGEVLARKGGLDFYDMDSLIVSEQGKNIPKIFEEHGEAYFRDLESRLLEGLLDKKEACVISTGGGIVTSPDNMDLIKRHGVSVWLLADIPVLLSRVGDGEGRPKLLQGDDPAGALGRLLNAREALYSKADIHIDNSRNDDPELVAEEILEAVVLCVDRTL